MAVNKLYQSVKYKVNLRDYSQTLNSKETLWKMEVFDISNDKSLPSITYPLPRTKFKNIKGIL